jgi:hypothetical protein
VAADGNALGPPYRSAALGIRARAVGTVCLERGTLLHRGSTRAWAPHRPIARRTVPGEINRHYFDRLPGAIAGVAVTGAEAGTVDRGDCAAQALAAGYFGGGRSWKCRCSVSGLRHAEQRSR